MVSIMDIQPKRQICDTRATLSQSAVSQKSIDLEIPIPLKSPTSPTSPTSAEQQSPPSPGHIDTELAKRTMKLDLVATEQQQHQSQSFSPTGGGGAASSSGIASASASTTTITTTATTHSSTSTANSAATTTTAAILMKHRKLKERTFSDELGSPKSPAAAIGRGGIGGGGGASSSSPPAPPLRLQTSLSSQSSQDVVDDRKALRDALYQGIFHRHRRTIFAVGSFLRMLKSRSSSYNTIRSSSEGEDDTR
ncbi:serine proteinase stubble isoform X1 [Uranotaenia lowii]|uniref:serine proteinase stubble isoform X1 n=1 Tax=Uranotaenia lowii TaxID=190385 RepID=UPI00247A18D4|nr:serine proteinase stubble isoform X1 [Uranotaenia lowii]